MNITKSTRRNPHLWILLAIMGVVNAGIIVALLVNGAIDLHTLTLINGFILADVTFTLSLSFIAICDVIYHAFTCAGPSLQYAQSVQTTQSAPSAPLLHSYHDGYDCGEPNYEQIV